MTIPKNPPSTTKLLPRDADVRHRINCGPPKFEAVPYLKCIWQVVFPKAFELLNILY